MIFYFKYPIVDRVKHLVSFSGGKDSSAMLIRMVEEGMPIDDIIFVKVMATPTIGGDFPEMYEYIEQMEDYIHRKITIIPSPVSFDEIFHQRFMSGVNEGDMYGFPVTIGAWCNERLKVRAINQYYKQYGEHIRYLGIAADEPERLIRLQDNFRAPLADWGMREKDCTEFLKVRNMVNPLYTKFKRLGCWFCVKQSLESLRVLRHDYPEYWNMLLAWDLKSPRTFRPDYTVRQLECKFAAEDCQLKIFDNEDYTDLLKAA